ncbi:hypothetical protein [Rhodococcus sp. NBC_00297]|uniref:hypothetical protein n=1 Tax=Rhodococcus sp. NBC_00297 TaxID=2976005 RepID=UPI002E291B28|nr:hypothetical protein [Rhodococcus sp. NBC_00297]
MRADLTIDDRYSEADGTLTMEGLERGRWLDAERAHGADWAELADQLEVHARVAQYLYRTWCGTGDGPVGDAECLLF